MPSDRTKDIATLVAQWRQRLVATSGNITDLAQAELVQRMRGRLTGDLGPPYRGATRDAASEAVDLIDLVLQDYLLLSGVVAEAEALVERRGLFRNTDADALALIEGPSIALQARPVALARRDLLIDSQATPRCTPARLLESARRAYLRARDLVHRIDEAERMVPARQEALTQQVAVLDARSVDAGVDRPAELVVDVTAMQGDPLGQHRLFDAMETCIARWRAALDQAATHYGSQRDRLAHADEQIRALVELIDRVRQDHARWAVAVTLSPPPALAAGEQVIDTLTAWHARLTRAVTDRQAAASTIDAGLHALAQSLALQQAQWQHTHDCLRRAVDELDSLRSRLATLTAAAAARPGDTLPSTDALLTVAHQRLRQSPIDLACLRDDVDALDVSLARWPSP